MIVRPLDKVAQPPKPEPPSRAAERDSDLSREWGRDGAFGRLHYVEQRLEQLLKAHKAHFAKMEQARRRQQGEHGP